MHTIDRLTHSMYFRAVLIGVSVLQSPAEWSNRVSTQFRSWLLCQSYAQLKFLLAFRTCWVIAYLFSSGKAHCALVLDLQCLKIKCPFAHSFRQPWGTSISSTLISSSWALISSRSFKWFMLTGFGFSCCGISSGAGSERGLGFVRSNSWGSVDFLGNFFGWLPLVVFFSRYSKRPSTSDCHLIKNTGSGLK